jgi:hypothetical protein
MYTIKLDRETLENLRVALEVALVATSPGVPLAFDEAYYLEINPDVRAAVEDRIFRSGYEHYQRHGKAEMLIGKRSPLITRPAVAPVPTPTPLPEIQWFPAESYLSADDLVRDVVKWNFEGAVAVDGALVHDGFGPAKQYWTWPDRSVQSRRPQSPKLNDSYASVDQLMTHARAIEWQWAILVDGKPVKGGFDADNQASHYETVGGLVQRVKR